MASSPVRPYLFRSSHKQPKPQEDARMLRFRFLLTLLIAGVLTLPLQAATITVADSGADYTSIQAAINAALNGMDIIVSPGTYVENINFNGKAITLRSASGDPADTIIDGGNSGSVVKFNSHETSAATLAGFTIQNGEAKYGAGIYVYNNTHPTFENLVVTGNAARNTSGSSGYGGGFSIYKDCNPTLTNITIHDNTAITYGGGIYLYDNCDPTLTNLTVSGNSGNEKGGGMYNDESSPTVTNCTFSGNGASGNGSYDGGGGMYNYQSSPAVTNCIFSDNSFARSGGGMANYTTATRQ